MTTIEYDSLMEHFEINYFKECSTLGALSEEAINFLLKQGDISQLDTGEVLYKPGEYGDCFFVVLCGSMDLYKYGSLIKNHAKGEELGMPSMIALQKRKGEAIAHEKTIILRITSSVFYKLHEALPTDFGILLLNLSRELARTLSKVSDIMAEREAAAISS